MKAVDSGNFDVAAYMGGIDRLPGGIHSNLSEDEIQKMMRVYRHQKTKKVNPLTAAKIAAKEAVTGAPGIVRGAYDVAKGLGQMEYNMREGVLMDLAGFDKRAGEDYDKATQASGKVVAGTEMGFQGAADLARKGVRRLKDAFVEGYKHPREAATALAIDSNPLLAPYRWFDKFNFLPGAKKKTKALTPKDSKTWDTRFWEDVAAAKQMAAIGQGEGEFGKLAVGGGEKTAKQVVEEAGGEISPEEIADMSGVLNPFWAAGPIASLAKKAGLGKIVPRPVSATPAAEISARPWLGKTMETVGSALEHHGAYTFRPVGRGLAVGAGAYGNPIGMTFAAVAPEAIRYIGRGIKNRGAKVVAGKASAAPQFGVKLYDAVKNNIVNPYYQGAKEAAFHPLTLGLAAFADDEQEMGHLFGGAAAFGGVLGVGVRGVGAGSSGVHDLLRSDLQKQGAKNVATEAFDPNFGEHAEMTSRNMGRMSPQDQNVVNSLRNNLRKMNIAEPDMDAIATTPPKMDAREWITGTETGGNGDVRYLTNEGRNIGPAEAGDVAWRAGQPLKDVTYSAEVVVGSPADAGDPRLLQSMGENARGNRGMATIRRGPEGEGKVTIYLNKDAFSAYHEATHALDWAQHPEQREQARQAVRKSYGDDVIEAARRFYAEMIADRDIRKAQNDLDTQPVSAGVRVFLNNRLQQLRSTRAWKPDLNMDPINPDAPTVVDATGGKYVIRMPDGESRNVGLEEAVKIAKANGQVRITENLALDEMIAETGNFALKSRSLQNVPDKLRQTAARHITQFLEEVGLVKPGLNVGQSDSFLGLTGSTVAENTWFNQFREAAGPQVTPASGKAEGQMVAPSGPEFYGSEGAGGTAKQRVANTGVKRVTPAPEPVPPVSPKAPISPGGKTPVTGEQPTPIRPGIVSVSGAKTTVTTAPGITEGERATILKGLREADIPEDIVNRVSDVLDSKGGPVELTYASATPEGLPPAELRIPRREEQKATYLKEEGAVNAELQKMAETTRTKFMRQFLPNRVIIRHGRSGEPQVNIEGLSPSKILQNAIILDRTIQQINTQLPPEQRMTLPYQEPGARGQVRFDYEALWDGLEKYTENQANGYTGEGNRLVRPEGFLEFTPPENPDFIPHKLPAIEASFLNMLMGVEPPKTTKARNPRGVRLETGEIKAVPTGEKAPGGLEGVEIQPTHVSAFQLSEANAPGRGQPSLTRSTGTSTPRPAPAKPWEVSVPTKAVRKGAPATVVQKGTFQDPVSGREFDIQEFNLLRHEITAKARAAGDKNFDLGDKLAEAFEELNAELIGDVRPAATGEGAALRYPSQTMVEAGFMPEENIRKRLKPALRTNGKIIEGQTGKTHQDIYDTLGVDGLIMKVEGAAEHGFVDSANPGEFLTREEAAAKLKQKGRLHSQDLIESAAMPDAEATKRRIVENEGVGMGVDRLKKAEIYPATSEAGKVLEGNAINLKKYESPGGFGVISAVDAAGKDVGHVNYRVQITPEGTLDARIEMIRSYAQGTRHTAAGKMHVAEALYRELANHAAEEGVSTISGDPINEKAVALRMKVFENTEIIDPVEGMPIVKAEDLQSRIDDAGGIIPFMHEYGLFDLRSFLAHDSRYLPGNPDAPEVPFLAAVKDIESGKVYTGAMHLFAYMSIPGKIGPEGYSRYVEGFQTNKKRFVSRDEAKDLVNQNLGTSIEGGLVSEKLPQVQHALQLTREQNLYGAPIKEFKAAVDRNLAKVRGESAAMPEDKQTQAAKEDFQKEDDFAASYLKDKIGLEEFPYYKDYEKTVNAEADAIAAEGGSKAIQFIGSGPLPLSAILLGKRFPNASMDLVDINPTALATGKEVADKAGLKNVTTTVADASKGFSSKNMDTIVLALEAGPNNASKKAVVENVLDRAPDSATVLIRSSNTADFPTVSEINPGWEITKRVPTWDGQGETLVVSRAMPEGQKDLELRHYSNVPGLKVLDPAKNGTGILGEERSRRRDYPEIYQPRTYYGMKGYKKEPGLGRYTYDAVVKDKNVYDYLKDPEDLYPSSTELKDAGYAPFDESAAVTMYEKAIKDAGFEGFKNTQAKVAALFNKQKVTQAKDSREMPDTNLFGETEYNSKAIQGMTAKELRAHFPEAIVLRGRPGGTVLNYDISKAPLLKGAKTEAEKVSRFKDKLVEFYKSVEDRPEVRAGKKWYSEFTPELKKAFGDDAQIFAELLAATSPNTNPEVNFGYASDAYFNWKAGNYEATVKKFMDGLDLMETGKWGKVYAEAIKKGAKRTAKGEPTTAEFLAWWIDSNKLQPRGSGGKLIGMHSTRVLQVLARKWLDLNKGPKTRTFITNLIGKGNEATIDVWAARTMRRLGYEGLKDRWRILPENSTGVTDPDFFLSQESFKAAAKELGMRPSSLQGALWFAEKSLWAERGWGRLDFGDFRAEMKKLRMLRQRFIQSEEIKARQKDIPKAEQESLF